MDKVEKTVVEMTQWETDEQLIWHEYGPELYLTVCQTGYVDKLRVQMKRNQAVQTLTDGKDID